LTRSGPHPSVHAPPPDDAGMAKGPDSGLIDLRGLSQSGEKPIPKDEELPELARTAPAAPSALKPSAPPATGTSAQVPPASAKPRSADIAGAKASTGTTGAATVAATTTEPPSVLASASGTPDEVATIDNAPEQNIPGSDDQQKTAMGNAKKPTSYAPNPPVG